MPFLDRCEWGVADPWLWAPEVGNSWRTTEVRGAGWLAAVRLPGLHESCMFLAVARPLLEGSFLAHSLALPSASPVPAPVQDIEPTWESILKIADYSQGLARFSGPGAWGDADMLEGAPRRPRLHASRAAARRLLRRGLLGRLRSRIRG